MNSEPPSSIPALQPLIPSGGKHLCAQMAIFTEVFQSKDLLFPSVLQSLRIANSFESNKSTATSLTSRYPASICCLFPSQLAFPTETSLKILLLFGSIAADACQTTPEQVVFTALTHLNTFTEAFPCSMF